MACIRAFEILPNWGSIFVEQPSIPVNPVLKLLGPGDPYGLIQSHILQCIQQPLDMHRRTAFSHQSDAPDLSGKIAEAAADFDVVLFQEFFT